MAGKSQVRKSMRNYPARSFTINAEFTWRFVHRQDTSFFTEQSLLLVCTASSDQRQEELAAKRFELLLRDLAARFDQSRKNLVTARRVARYGLVPGNLATTVFRHYHLWGNGEVNQQQENLVTARHQNKMRF